MGDKHQRSATVRICRRVAVIVAGTVVVLIGCVMIVTPGPALLVIPAGISIFAIEFGWAKRLLVRIRRSGNSLTSVISQWWNGVRHKK